MRSDPASPWSGSARWAGSCCRATVTRMIAQVGRAFHEPELKRIAKNADG